MSAMSTHPLMLLFRDGLFESCLQSWQYNSSLKQSSVKCYVVPRKILSFKAINNKFNMDFFWKNRLQNWPKPCITSLFKKFGKYLYVLWHHDLRQKPRSLPQLLQLLNKNISFFYNEIIIFKRSHSFMAVRLNKDKVEKTALVINNTVSRWMPIKNLFCLPTSFLTHFTNSTRIGVINLNWWVVC